MRAVEICLPASELPKQMAAMRVWLDEQRFEPSSFACRNSQHGMSVCLEFNNPQQAKEFAERFGGRAASPLRATLENEAAGEVMRSDLSPSGIVG